MTPTFTIGIEEEYQTVDPETRDLRSHIHAEIIEKGKLILQERVKTEMHQSVVEVGTSVCANIKEAREELKSLRRHMIRLARENGLRLAAAATHPFADWRVQEITPGERYKNIVRGYAIGGAGQSDFRAARARGHRGSRDHDPLDESCAVFCASPAGAVDEFAFLAGDGYRTEIVSLQSVRQVSADELARLFSELGRVRELRQAAGEDELDR